MRSATALGLSDGRDVSYLGILGVGLCADSVRAQSLADEFARRFPQSTVVQSNYLPTIYAQLAINRANYLKAIEALKAATPYELGSTASGALPLALYPVYVRAEAYLAGGQGTEGVAEFQRVLDHHGLLVNEPIAPLARLGLARAYALQRDTAKARAATNSFSLSGKTPTPTSPS
jgi:predicted Zn-dependent protease